jgi:hypothetical protein
MWNSSPALSLLIVASLAAGTGTARAQAANAPNPSRSLAAAAFAAAQQTVPDAPMKKRKNPVLIGALIGGAAAAALTAWAANAYGHNEGGSFCGACFAQWGAIAIPAGAGIGAGIGVAVRAASPDQRPGPYPPVAGSGRTLPGRRQELAVTFRF